MHPQATEADVVTFHPLGLKICLEILLQKKHFVLVCCSVVLQSESKACVRHT